MMAAITAAKNGTETLLLEGEKRVGIKLAMTGNGRCNFTNLLQEPQHYRGQEPLFGYEVVKKFPPEQVIAFFRTAGLITKEKQGYCYPVSEQASSVSEILAQICYRSGVKMLFEHKVHSVLCRRDGFTVTAYTPDGKKIFAADRVILACGGCTYPKTGSDGSGFLLAKACGHSIVPLMPVMAGAEVCQNEREFFKMTAGVRQNASVSVVLSDGTAHREEGELQLTAYGISGIPVFILSRYLAQELQQKQTAAVVLDFAPCMTECELTAYLQKQAAKWNMALEKHLWGFLNQKLAAAILMEAGCRPNQKSASLKKEDIDRIVRRIKRMEILITCIHEPEKGQVTAGGVSTGELDADTMESRICPGLFFCGEMVDVDGSCGGYNLQFAWSSGYLAGKSASLEPDSVR